MTTRYPAAESPAAAGTAGRPPMRQRSPLADALHRVAALLISSSLAPTAMALDIDTLWDYGNPAQSEQRFNAALAGAGTDEQLILRTQIARTHGLRRDFAKAREVLAAVEPALTRASPEAQVRYHLELGRSLASTAHTAADRTPENLARARSAYLRAHELAAAARLDALAIDALHMMAIVDPDPARQLGWNEKAIQLLERSDQVDAKRWEGSLRNNIGVAKRLSGAHEAALAEFRLSRAAYQRSGRTRNVRIADWMIARTYRDQRRYGDALAIQLELERDWDAEGQPDPYVYEELEHLYRALGNEERATYYRDKLLAARK